MSWNLDGYDVLLTPQHQVFESDWSEAITISCSYYYYNINISILSSYPSAQGGRGGVLGHGPQSISANTCAKKRFDSESTHLKWIKQDMCFRFLLVLLKCSFYAEGQRRSPAEVPPEREENLIADHFVIYINMYSLFLTNVWKSLTWTLFSSAGSSHDLFLYVDSSYKLCWKTSSVWGETWHRSSPPKTISCSEKPRQIRAPRD